MERGNPELVRTFRAYGGDALKSPDAYVIQQMTGKTYVPRKEVRVTPQRGRPDYYAILPPFGFFIEAKYAPENFQLSSLSESQRGFLTQHIRSSWLWLWMGVKPPNAKVNARQAWLIPWANWLHVEEKLALAGLKGLALNTPQALDHREMGLDACHLLEEYHLLWATGERRWVIPTPHPFWTRPLEMIRHFYPEMDDDHAL